MEWYTLADDLSTLKRLVASGFMDYESATKTVRLLVADYLGK